MENSQKEEYAIILDFLPNGYPFDTKPAHRKLPVAQAIGEKTFALLELAPKKEVNLQPNQRVYVGEGKRDEIHHIVGRILLDRLTQTARGELDFVIKELVTNNPQPFLDFFNKCGSINARRHQLELLPGIGKKHMWEILEQRKEKPFENFDDIKKRIKLLPNPEKSVIKRILLELNEDDKYKIFTR
ncbi:MAG: DUF655 domain-containing protein [archaeon]